MTDMKNKIDELQKYIDESKKIVFFGGAGVSTESGIPDFRSETGLYSQKFDYPAELILSHSFFLQKTEYFFNFYRSKCLLLEAKPNKAHFKLAELEKAGKLLAVVTQNIDGLHQKAGSQKVYELHGSVHRNYCMECGKNYDPYTIVDCEGIPRCECGGIIKPDVVLFEEGLDDETIRGSLEAISRADLMIVAGTSLNVYPAAGMLDYFRGKKLVLINKTATPFDSKADLVINDKVGEVLSQIVVK